MPTKRTRDIARAAATAPRPRAHLTPETGWLNDPHGVYFLDGRYHAFFQHVPDSLEWRSDLHWGHATSTNLLHWQWEPIALSPGDGDDGCWSGCAVISDDGKPALFYTSAAGADHQVASIRIARPSGDGAWVKGAVVAKAPRRNIRLFRDPMVFRDGPDWRMLVGAGTTDGTAEVHTFISPGDLESWDYDGVLASRHTKSQHPWTGTGWECPQLIRANGDGTDVLIVSIWDDHTPHDVAATTGTYADGRFTPHRWRLLTTGRGHFAASTFTDAEDRTSILFWVRRIADPGNWSGALSIPYVLTTDGDEIRLRPHPAVAGARTNPLGAPGAAIDVEWESAVGQRLTLEDADGREHAVIEAAEGRITITVPEQAPVDVTHTSPTLRIIADIHVLEVVADSGLVGLPLPATASGLVPRTDTANIRWWHLT